MLLEDVSDATAHDSESEEGADWTRSSDLIVLVGSTLETETGLVSWHQELVTKVHHFYYIAKIT